MNFGEMNFMIYAGLLGMLVGIVLLIFVATRKEKPQPQSQLDNTPAWIRKKEKAKRRKK